MILILGLIAIIFAILNLVFYFKGKDYKYFMFLSLAFTAHTIWAHMNNFIIHYGDVSIYEDFLLFSGKPFLFLTIASFIINGLPLVLKDRQNN